MNESQVIWTEPGLGNDTQSSYLMCQMNWHSVRVTKKGPNVTITLDELHSVSSLMGHGTNMSVVLKVDAMAEVGDLHINFSRCLLDDGG